MPSVRDVDGVPTHRALTRRRESDAVTRAATSRIDIEIGVPKRLAGQRTKRDRLVSLRDVEALSHIRGRVVVTVAGLRRRDRAMPSVRDVDGVPTHRALTRRRESDAVTRAATSRIDIEIGVPKRLAGQRPKRDRLVSLRDV